MADEHLREGDGDGDDVDRRAHARRIARGLRSAARRALDLARTYRNEEGPGGRRELACVAQALAWRRAARAKTRDWQRGTGPGLARALADARIEARAAQRRVS